MDSVEISVEGVSVMIGMPCKGGVEPKTMKAIAETFYRCGLMRMEAGLAVEISGVVEIGRDSVVDDFLKSSAQKLFWIDSDMVWTAGDFLRMVALSTKVDVVTASYPAKIEGQTTFLLKMLGPELTIEEYGLVEIEGIGLGFAVVDRAVIEALAAKAPRVKDQINGREMAAIFRNDIVDGRRRTEDIAFFSDIRALGYKVWLDPNVCLGHVGAKEYTGSILDAMVPNG